LIKEIKFDSCFELMVNFILVKNLIESKILIMKNNISNRISRRNN